MEENKKISMFDILKERQEILRIIEENEGEIPPDLHNYFEINGKNLRTKSESLLDWYEDLKAKEKMAEDRIKQAQKYLSQQKRLIHRIEESLKRAVGVYGPIEIDTRRINVRKSTSVQVEYNEHGHPLVPEEYRTRKVEIKPDLKKIKIAINSGKEVPGASLQTNQNLNIY